MYIIGFKKTVVIVESSLEILEIDELYWVVFRKPRTGTHENIYLMTMVSRTPREIVGFDVAGDKEPERIQKVADTVPSSLKYCADGFLGYIDVLYPGKHVRNVRDKSDIYTVEGVNADLRHYIAILTRRSRCFA